MVLRTQRFGTRKLKDLTDVELAMALGVLGVCASGLSHGMDLWRRGYNRAVKSLGSEPGFERCSPMKWPLALQGLTQTFPACFRAHLGKEANRRGQCEN